MRKRRSASYYWWEEAPQAQPRACDYLGCTHEGHYKAPKSRHQLNEYYWFCLDHVREYNKSWDYYKGMTAEQIETHIRFDTVWQKTTWPMGSWRAERILRDRLAEDFDIGEKASSQRQETKTSPPNQPLEALAIFNLSPPVTFAEIKLRYRRLVKENHPDVHGGNKEAEERLKIINHAYTVLKDFYGE